MSYLWKTAWRDGRHHLRRLVLCALSIVFGVAAMVAIDSFVANVEVAIETEAKTLLGADLQVSSRTPFSSEAEAWIESLGGDQSREIRFSSMALFEEAEQTRLVQVRALSSGFPYYGEFETEPAGANPAATEEPVIVLDPVLMAQYELVLGDWVVLGNTRFEIIGELVKMPGESAFAGTFAPRAYISLAQLEETGLMGTGSIAFHRAYIHEPDLDTEAIRAYVKETFPDERINLDDIEERKESIGRPLTNLSRYLGLVGFIALLLGGVGIAGTVQAYLTEKRDTVAILRCLGSSAGWASQVFLVQVMGIALIGAAMGALLGVLVQTVLPRMLGDWLPVDIEYFVNVPSILAGVGFGALIALLFAIYPLLPLRRISPLRALRASIQPTVHQRDPLQRPWIVLTVLALAGFCALRTDPWYHGLIFAGVLGLVLLIFLGIAVGIQRALKQWVRPRHYLLRQAFSNLHRPQNRTAFLIVSIGLGTFLVSTLTLVQSGLLQQSDIQMNSDQPNLLMFDIQPDQRPDLYNIIDEGGMEIFEDAPIVTMRLQAVKDRTVAEIKADPNTEIDNWILNREWRNTYRGELGPSETLQSGNYVSSWDGLKQPVPISLEDDMAADLGVTLGDTLVFDVQGIPVEVEVSSLRTVDWRQMRPNFFATFPTGVLESAPHWWIAVTRSPDVETTARLQRDIFRVFPNVSVVDMKVILESLESIVSKISFAIRFMALFTIATGIVVLASAVTTSRYQRVRESILLRTLGAQSGQVRWIMAIEYALVGAVAATVGTLLSIAGSLGLAYWLLNIEMTLPWLTCGATIVAVSGLTLLTGLLNSRGISSHPPLEILREEG
ncbi:MAG: ABC transporter permease [Opitutales bacterium]|nr:ABC transporter permease [Opitutales bacterium]NRA28223.1 ABC transporter permease [Opitutales bacterium]